jgi:hypothetical protein
MNELKEVYLGLKYKRSLQQLLHETFAPGLSFASQRVLVTSVTSRLGLDTTIHHINLNADLVIITARTAYHGMEAQKTIEEHTSKTEIV